MKIFNRLNVTEIDQNKYKILIITPPASNFKQGYVLVSLISYI